MYSEVQSSEVPKLGFFLTKSKCPFKSRIMEEKWICNCAHNQRGTFFGALKNVKYVGF